MQKTITRIHDFKLPTAILGACLLQDHRELIAACLDGIYRVELDTKKHQRIGGHDSYVSSAVYIPEQQTFITAGYDGKLKWFSAQDNSLLREEKVHAFWSWDMALSADQRWLASVTGQYLAGDYKYSPAQETEASVKILDATDGKLVHALRHVPSVQSVAFSADGSLLAAGNTGTEVRVYETASGKKKATLSGHAGSVFALKFSPDGKRLYTAGFEGIIRVFDPVSGRLQAIFYPVPLTPVRQTAQN